MQWSRVLVLIPALWLAGAAAAAAAPFLVCNTGVAPACGAQLPDTSIDPNYVLIATPTGPKSAQVVPHDGFPMPPWVADSTTASWIGPADGGSDSLGPIGTYVYRTSFDLTGYDPSTAVLSGDWATDDPGALYLNGVNTGFTSTAFIALSSFSLNTGFLPGLNYLDFSVFNATGPTGLLVENLAGTADLLVAPVPEPETLGLLALGLAAIGARRRLASR